MPPNCGSCGACCGPVFFLESEAMMIQRFAITHGLTIPDSVEGDTCPMLKDGKCLIYPVRPITCRLFGIIPKLTCARNLKKEYGLPALLLDRMKQYHDECRAPGQKVFTLGFDLNQVVADHKSAARQRALENNLAACAER